MEPIPFYKMNGCGNDFIIIDARSAGVPADLENFIQRKHRSGSTTR